MPPGPTERSRSYSRPDHNNGSTRSRDRGNTGRREHHARDLCSQRHGKSPSGGMENHRRRVQHDHHSSNGTCKRASCSIACMQPPRQQQQQPQQQQARMPQGSAGPQPIGRPMPPPSMVQTGMQQQQNMPMYNGLMQPVDVRTGLPMQITGMPPMGGAPLGMAPRGVVPQQQGMQPAGHIIPPGGTMVGASTQQLGMMPPMMGMTGMQPTHLRATGDGHGHDADGHDDATGHDVTGTHGSADGRHGHAADRHKLADARTASDEHDTAGRHGGATRHDTTGDHATRTCSEHASTDGTRTRSGYAAATTETDDTAAYGRDEPGTRLAGGIPHTGAARSHA